MKTLMTSLLAAAALAAALPASAQSWGGSDGYYRDQTRAPAVQCGDGDRDEAGDFAPDNGLGQARLSAEINEAQRDGRLSYWDAQRLRWKLQAIGRWEARTCSKGFLTVQERITLGRTYRDVYAQLNAETNRRGYGDRGGYGGFGGGYGSWGDRRGG